MRCVKNQSSASQRSKHTCAPVAGQTAIAWQLAEAGQRSSLAVPSESTANSQYVPDESGTYEMGPTKCLGSVPPKVSSPDSPAADAR
jgi:hypothetical protein